MTLLPFVTLVPAAGSLEMTSFARPSASGSSTGLATSPNFVSEVVASSTDSPFSGGTATSGFPVETTMPTSAFVSTF